MSTRNLRDRDHRALTIAPSILAADFARLGEEIATVEKHGADVLHIDIMDGHFVPNLSIGPPVVKSIRPVSDLLFDVHLMLSNPAQYVAPFVEAGADHITIHAECEDNVPATLEAIHKAGCTAGLSLKPGTAVDAVLPYLEEIQMVLVMSVEPGFGGQSFMAETLPKMGALRAAADAGDTPLHIEVDGGIDTTTGPQCVTAGANVLVAGSSIFRAPDGAPAAIAALRAACN